MTFDHLHSVTPINWHLFAYFHASKFDSSITVHTNRDLYCQSGPLNLLLGYVLCPAFVAAIIINAADQRLMLDLLSSFLLLLLYLEYLRF